MRYTSTLIATKCHEQLECVASNIIHYDIRPPRTSMVLPGGTRMQSSLAALLEAFDSRGVATPGFGRLFVCLFVISSTNLGLTSLIRRM